MSSPVVRSPAAGRPPVPGVIGAGRPPWWLLGVSLLVTAAVTVDLLTGGVLEQLDLWVSGIVGGWGLRDSDAYWLAWVFTQAGGRGTILIVMAALVAYLCWTRRTVTPLVRVAVALTLLTTTVYAFKWGTGRTAPTYPGSYFHLDGESYPSGHVANAVLMWGVARWQAVQFGLGAGVQRAFWVLGVVGPVVTGVAMVALDFHWVTDVLVGGTVGVLLLGVVHALDAALLSRFTRVKTGRRSTERA